jgi:hypothetical protein
MRVSNIFVVGDPWTRYEVTYFGKDGADAHDLNLTADSLVFKKSKDNTITPTSINLTAKTANLTGGQLKWFNTDNNNSTSSSNTLSYTNFGIGSKQKTIKVQYVKNNTV